MPTYSWGNTLDELRQREAELKASPTVEGYIELADRFSGLGLSKEAARAYKMAEQCEGMDGSGSTPEPEPLLNGNLTKGMVVEIIQIIVNTRRTGEMVVATTGSAETIRLYFENGRVINATGTRTMRGQKSFERSLTLGDGTYKFFERAIDHIDVLFEQSTDHLLLTTLQRLDEQVHWRQQFDSTT
jgi:Domain of unknown function (DUF4388)